MFVYLRAQPTFIAARYTITSPRRPRDVGRLAGGRVRHVPQPYGDGATSGTSSRKLAQILWMLSFVGACNSNKFLQLRQFDQVRRSLLDRLPPGRHHLLLLKQKKAKKPQSLINIPFPTIPHLVHPMHSACRGARPLCQPPLCRLQLVTCTRQNTRPSLLPHSRWEEFVLIRRRLYTDGHLR